MDAPLAVSAQKENVQIGGGKATSLLKTDKVKPARTTGKQRKALADLKNIYDPITVASKKVVLQQKAAVKDNQVKSNPMIKVKEHKAVVELRSYKKSLGADLNTKSALLESLGKGNTPLGNVLTDEEIKRCYEWAKNGIEGMGGYSCHAKNETEVFLKQNLSEIMASVIGVPISELESPFLSDDEVYETDESDLGISQTFPEHLTSIYAEEELEDLLGEYPLPELKLKDD